MRWRWFRILEGYPWRTQTNGFDAYKVLVTGKIFKTNEQLLPDEEANYGDDYNQAFKYCHPKFKDVHECTNEYLAQGKIKILSKVK